MELSPSQTLLIIMSPFQVGLEGLLLADMILPKGTDVPPMTTHLAELSPGPTQPQRAGSASLPHTQSQGARNSWWIAMTFTGRTVIIKAEQKVSIPANKALPVYHQPFIKNIPASTRDQALYYCIPDTCPIILWLAWTCHIQPIIYPPAWAIWLLPSMLPLIAEPTMWISCD